MESEAGAGLTLILERARAGDDGARAEVISKIYEELRQVAARMMLRERPGHTLSPTAVVHEAVMRLLGEAVFDRAPDRNFLFAAAARAMRRFSSTTRGGGRPARRSGKWERVPLDLVVEYFEAQDLDVSAVHEAIVRLDRDQRTPGPGHHAPLFRRPDRSRGRPGAGGCGRHRRNGIVASRGPGFMASSETGGSNES